MSTGNITTIWSDKKNCVFVFISVNLTGDSALLIEISWAHITNIRKKTKKRLILINVSISRFLFI